MNFIRFNIFSTINSSCNNHYSSISRLPEIQNQPDPVLLRPGLLLRDASAPRVEEVPVQAKRHPVGQLGFQRQRRRTDQLQVRPLLLPVHRGFRRPPHRQHLPHRQANGAELLHRRVLHVGRRLLRRRPRRHRRQEQKNFQIFSAEVHFRHTE